MSTTDITKKWVRLAQEALREKVVYISHIRLNIFPDGDISRLRVFGKPAEA